MGKTFKDQKRYDRKKRPNLPRVRIDWDTGTRVHPDERRRTRDKGWTDDLDDWTNEASPDDELEPAA